MLKISQKDSFQHETNVLKGYYYQLPEVNGGQSVVYAEVTGDHGQRIIKDKKARIYYIIAGEGEFIVNGEKTLARKGDVIVIPPNGTYSYHATKPVLKLLLVMDLIDLTKLPPTKK